MSPNFAASELLESIPTISDALTAGESADIVENLVGAEKGSDELAEYLLSDAETEKAMVEGVGASFIEMEKNSLTAEGFNYGDFEDDFATLEGEFDFLSQEASSVESAFNVEVQGILNAGEATAPSMGIESIAPEYVTNSTNESYVSSFTPQEGEFGGNPGEWLLIDEEPLKPETLQTIDTIVTEIEPTDDDFEGVQDLKTYVESDPDLEDFQKPFTPEQEIFREELLETIFDEQVPLFTNNPELVVTNPEVVGNSLGNVAENIQGDEEQDLAKLLMRVAVKVGFRAAAALAKNMAKNSDSKEAAIFFGTVGDLLGQGEKLVDNMISGKTNSKLTPDIIAAVHKN